MAAILNFNHLNNFPDVHHGFSDFPQFSESFYMLTDALARNISHEITYRPLQEVAITCINVLLLPSCIYIYIYIYIYIRINLYKWLYLYLFRPVNIFYLPMSRVWSLVRQNKSSVDIIFLGLTIQYI